jgi:hypothetical protein
MVDILLTLYDVHVSANYDTNPATQIQNGVLLGFLTKEDADLIPVTLGIGEQDGDSLSKFLPGGGGPCDSEAGNDLDLHPNYGEGWWMYLHTDTANKVNFEN